MFIFAANKVSAEILISISDLFWELSVEWMCATGSTLHSSNSLGILSLLFHDEGGNGLALCEWLSLGYHRTHCHLSLQMDFAEIALHYIDMVIMYLYIRTFRSWWSQQVVMVVAYCCYSPWRKISLEFHGSGNYLQHMKVLTCSYWNKNASGQLYGYQCWPLLNPVLKAEGE